MTGLDGLNPTTGALVLGLVQARVPIIRTSSDLKDTALRLADTVRRAKTGMPSIDLAVMPEYSINGLDPATWLDDDLLCDRNGPEIAILAEACRDAAVWGCFSIMERNPDSAPWNSGLIFDDTGTERLYYRKMHPWVPAEPWAPGDLGVQVCDGPAGSRLALIICHDGMLPEMAREAAYKGANVILRTAGYTYPIRQAWQITNQANAFQNLAYTASVALAGPDQNNFWSQGEAMVCDLDGSVLVRGDNTPDRVVTAEVIPARVDEARREWGVENNIYQLGHRGYSAVVGGVRDCPYTFMQDLVAGEYEVPWESEVRHTDGTAAGWGLPETVRARTGPKD